MADNLIESGREGPEPIFSICVPQHNRTSFFVIAIASYAEQTLRPVEICVSDGGSTDGRQGEVVAALRASGLPFAYSRSEVNLQYDPNLRAAIGLARGQYCLLMGNDDAFNGPDALSQLWQAIREAGFPAVVLHDFSDYATARPAGAIRRNAHYPAGGPDVAVRHFRNYSFVGAVTFERAETQRLSTVKWDGSEMYQMYLGTSLVAAGGGLLLRTAPVVRKDIQVPGERVDAVTTRPKVWPCPVVERPLPLGQIGRLVIDGAARGGASRRRDELVLAQLLGITYPYWLVKYRAVQSWRFALGVALGMRPTRTAAGVRLGWRRGRVWALYLLATFAGLAVPHRAFTRVQSTLYKLAR